MRRWRAAAVGALACVALCPGGTALGQPDHTPHALSVYAGIGTGQGIERFLYLDFDRRDSYMAAVGYAREWARWRDSIAFEWEVNAARHWRYQTHAELNALLVARWLRFPWNDTVRTTVAVGNGLSWATGIPAIERERSPEVQSRLLDYLMLEFTVGPPQGDWSFVGRIHHRSGAFGTFNGVYGGSNIVAVGLRKHF